MKTLHPRIVYAVRASHSSSLLTTSSPSTAPHSPSSSSRIPPKPKQQQQHNSPNPLALTPAPPPSHPPPSHLQSLALSLPYSPPIVPGFSNSLIFPQSSSAKESDTAQRRTRRKRLSRTPYTLEVGAYGIPKKHSPVVQSLPDLDLAVPIGEDAYFVRQDAVGVADGIGGWARARAGRPTVALDNVGMGVGVSPSAMFATRMMHCVSDELKIKRQGGLSHPQLLSHDPPTQEDDFAADPLDSQSNLEEELESHLEDLEEGIDILQILERAYERTWKGHLHQETGERVVLGGATVMVAALDWADEDKPSQPPEADESREAFRPAPDPEPIPVLKVAQIGDCMGMLVRGDDIVWRSEEMWWDYNTPVQLSPPPLTQLSSPEGKGRPSSPMIESASTLLSPLFPCNPPLKEFYNQAAPTNLPFHASQMRNRPSPSPSFPRTASPPNHTSPIVDIITPSMTARVTTLPVQADDILVLASDGLGDNLWDEEVLDEVLRFKGRSMGATANLPSGLPTPPLSPFPSTSVSPSKTPTTVPTISTISPSSIASLLQRHTLAEKLSEALCSRAKRVSERRRDGVGSSWLQSPSVGGAVNEDGDETPFGRRAKEFGKVFRGGKRDDISVVVAVVSPPLVQMSRS
ncbi:hypothetical protein BDZ94DRAFT_1271553 [Collybia nuda]|uniref:Protein phosphatase n=1 Tax=Collybia nuda TaxID=64659 RepID=A0A9P5XWG3_9AGAR|nr:hypothetical protein BDZ94DRAFT_1271553 [Collybia nuda]